MTSTANLTSKDIYQQDDDNNDVVDDPMEDIDNNYDVGLEED